MDLIKNIDEKLGTVLDGNIDYFYGWYDENINKPHVTFTIIEDTEEDFSDNTAECISTEFQIDIWISEDNMQDYDIEQLTKEIKKAIKMLDRCTYKYGANLYEKDTKIYHKSLRFEIVGDINE